MRCCAGSVQYRSNPGNVFEIIQIDDDIITLLAHFPEVLPVVTKLAVVTESISMGQNEQVRFSAHGSIIPVLKGNGTNELTYTIPYHL